MRLKVIITIFFTLCFFKNVLCTPDLIEEANGVTYRLSDNRIATIELSDNSDLVSLMYGIRGDLDVLPSEIASKISDVDIYSVEIAYSLGVKEDNSWLAVDEIYIYLKFEQYAQGRDKKILPGEYELKVVFLNCEFISASIINLKTGIIIAKFKGV